MFIKAPTKQSSKSVNMTRYTTSQLFYGMRPMYTGNIYDSLFTAYLAVWCENSLVATIFSCTKNCVAISRWRKSVKFKPIAIRF